MRKIAMAAAVAAMLLGSLGTAPAAQAAQTSTTQDTIVYTRPQEPTVKAFDCEGTTGRMGCGPGWFWRDGWRGWGCYPC
jgi:hypothetical protein